MPIVDKELLLIFKSDVTVGRMYDEAARKGLERDVVRETFVALKALKLIAATNDHETTRQSFCITEAGRTYLQARHRVQLERPEAKVRIGFNAEDVLVKEVT